MGLKNRVARQQEGASRRHKAKIGRGYQKIDFLLLSPRFPSSVHRLLSFKNDIWTNSQNNTGDVATVYLMLERPRCGDAVDTRNSVIHVHRLLKK